MTHRLIVWCVLALTIGACSRGETAGLPNPAVFRPQRIISLAPNVTEMLFALGLGPQVIAVGDFDQFPPEVRTRERIGGLINPNIERIIELRPDLVITYGTQEVLSSQLAELRIRAFPYTHGNIQQTLTYVESLGELVDRQKEALAITTRIHQAFDALRFSAPLSRPRVLLLHGRGTGLMGGFYSVGARAFQHELIEIAGGQNLFGDVDREIIQPTLEEVLARQPDVIIETLAPDRSTAEIESHRTDWGRFPDLPAVKLGRVYVVSEDYMLSPGPRVDLAAQKYAELIRSEP